MIKYQSIIKRERPIVRRQERPVVRPETGQEASLYRRIRSDIDRRFKRMR